MSYDPRWGDDPRDRDDSRRDLSRGSRGGSDPRERERVEPRDVFVDRVSLPRGAEREHIRFRDRDYTLRDSESRTLASVGAFRVVPTHDLRDKFDKPLDPRHGELWHLRDSGLVETVRLDRDTSAVTLTKEGRDLLEASRRDADSPDRQTFNHGVQKPRELKHDAEASGPPVSAACPREHGCSRRAANCADAASRNTNTAAHSRALPKRRAGLVVAIRRPGRRGHLGLPGIGHQLDPFDNAAAANLEDLHDGTRRSELQTEGIAVPHFCRRHFLLARAQRLDRADGVAKLRGLLEPLRERGLGHAVTQPHHQLVAAPLEE